MTTDTYNRSSGMQPLPTPKEDKIASIDGLGAVSQPPTRPSKFTLNGSYLLTQIMTYHYHNNNKSPGKISLEHEDGTLYGPWQASGAVGQGNVPNAYWYAQPNVVLKPGEYEVHDTDPATWSHEATTGGRGIMIAWGRHKGGQSGDANQSGENAGQSGQSNQSGQSAGQHGKR